MCIRDRVNTIHLTHRENFPLGTNKFILYPNTLRADSLSSIFTSEVRLDTRISFHERWVSGEFYRTSLGSAYPIILISYRYGIPDLFNNDFGYHKLTLDVQQWFNFATIGWSKY